jgi:predicted ATPase/DNA-binding XRE family transcriptional regulator
VNSTRSRSFGELLREYRVAAGLTQEALAERAQMSLATVGKLERGESQRPYRATVALLADALSLSANERGDLERAALHHGPPDDPGPARGAQSRSNLPLQLSSFVGREGDLARIGEMLAASRIVTLIGTGGVGKTRLALRVAELSIASGALNSYFDSIWFVDLSRVAEAQMVTTAIASSVGMQRCRSLEALIGYLSSQRFLLLLDNCEHVVDQVVQAGGELLRRCPNARIFATSRQALGLEGERIHRVPPLSVPPADVDLSLERIFEFSSIRLFADRAEATDSRFELTASTIPAVAEICRRLDGIALAIELAAARTNAFSPATIALHLDKHVMDLTRGIPDSGRHETMAAVFDWSYNLLDDREQRIFRKLSVFVGGFTLELATSLAQDECEESLLIKTLSSLVERSLIQCDLYAEPARYNMLEPARQYARDKLREREECDSVSRSHALALLALAEDFDARLELIPDRTWDAYVERERDNFRVALEFTLGQRGDAYLGQRLAISRTATWNGFRTGEVRKWMAAALDARSEVTPPQMLATLAISAARADIIFGPTWSPENDPDARVDACRRALTLQLPSDLLACAAANFWLGAALRDVARYGDADYALREARALAGSAGAYQIYNHATIALGQVCYGSGDLREARELIAEALRSSEQAGCDRAAASARATLAEIEFASGRTEEALRLIEKTTQYFRSHSDLIALHMSLGNSAAYLVVLERYQDARDNALEALRISRTIGTVQSAFWAMQHLAAAAVLGRSLGGDDAALHRAANILGFVDEMVKQRGMPRYHTEQQEYERLLSALRVAFEADELAKLVEEGKTWPEDRAVAEALML